MRISPRIRNQSAAFAVLLLVMIVTGVGALALQQPDARATWTVKKESFDKDPAWEARFSKVDYHPPQRIRQDYGFDAKIRSIGGDVWRSASRPTWYAKVLPRTVSLKDRIRVEGRFRLAAMDLPVDVPGVRTYSGFHNASDCFIGFFNSERQGWRPQNWLGVRFRALRAPGEKGSALVELTYTTKSWRTGPAFSDANPQMHVEPGEAWHSFAIDYDPDGNGGGGTLGLTLDGQRGVGNLWPNHKMEDALFNRFGIRSNQVPGRKMTAYFDDLKLTVNGKTATDTFDADPNWEGRDNRALYLEQVQYGENDFGYRPTNHAGGAKGEIGGRFWNVNPSPAELLGQYGDPKIGTLSMEAPLHASGKIGLQKFDTDGSMLIGFYNARKLGSPPENFIGILIDGPARTGRYFRPIYGNADAKGDGAALDDPANPPLAIEPYSRHEWSMDYDPAANNGAGAITLTLNGKKWVVNVKPEDRKVGAVFDRFGMLNEQRANGNSAEVYLDDLKYIVAREP